MNAGHARSRTSRTLAAVAACAGLALVLAGCVKIEADLAVNSDATASGTFNLALQKQAASMLGMTDLDAFTAGMSDDELSGEGSEIFQAGDCAPSETDTDFVYACTFSNMAFTDSGGPWQIVKSGNDITFTLTSDGSQDGDSGELLGDASLGTMTVKVAFPGEISEISGAEKTSDTTATVTGSMNDAFNVKIVSAAGGGGVKVATMLVVLIGLLVLALIIVVAIVLIMRRRKPSGDPGAAYVVPPPAPGAGPTDAAAPTVAGIALAEASMAETAVSEPVATQVPEEPTIVAAPPVEPPAPPVAPPTPPAQPEEPTPPA